VILITWIRSAGCAFNISGLILYERLLWRTLQDKYEKDLDALRADQRQLAAQAAAAKELADAQKQVLNKRVWMNPPILGNYGIYIEGTAYTMQSSIDVIRYEY
jgi:hypothetical protein